MSSLEKTVRDIKNFKVQGANQIAIYGLKFLREFAKKEGFKLKFETAAYFLEEARPTAVVLHNCIEKVKQNRNLRTIDRLISHLEHVSHREGRHSDKIIKKGMTIMTYCHSGEAMTFIKHAWVEHGRPIAVFACETNPRDQGLKSAKEIHATGIPVTLIGDNSASFFMKDVDMVVVGADAMREEGLVNKIGTSMIAHAAKAHKKPFYVVANTLKIDRRKKFKIEERSPEEVARGFIDRKGLKGIKVRNPAFDITPWKYVTAVITEKGRMKPEKVAKMASKKEK